MTTPAKPLTAGEIARIKRYVSGHRGLATPLAAEEGQSLIATIEQQAEQIEKLRKALTTISMMPPLVMLDTDGTKTKYDAEIQIARKALAATEPVNDKR